MAQRNLNYTRMEQVERTATGRGLLSRAKLKQRQEFIPKASMPRIWWQTLAAVHQMTEDRIQTIYPNICRYLNRQFSSSQLYCIVRKGLLVKDKNNQVIYGLTDLGYEFLEEYSQLVSCEQDAEALGFYHQTLQINMLIREVAA